MVRKYNKRENDLAIENAKLKQLIAGDGGSPGQPYTPPKEDPKNPWVPAPGKGDKKLVLSPNDKFRIPVGTPPPNDRMYGIPTLPKGHPMYNKWANQMMINNQPIAHRSHKPNTRDYHNPAQHNAPVDPGGNPIKRSPSNKHLFPTHREIDERNKGHWNVDPENYTPDGMLISSTPEFYKKENIGGTLMDVVLPLLIQKYGKGPDGKYKDPDKLIEMMGKLRGV